MARSRSIASLTHREPANAEAFYDLGLALKQTDRVRGGGDGAQERAAPRIRRCPKRRTRWAWCCGRPGAARRPRRSSATPSPRRPDYAEAHYMLGTVLRQLGDADGALREFRETIRINPNSPEAYTSIGQLLTAAHDSKGAAEAFASAARLNKAKADSQAAVFAVNAGRERLRQSDLRGAIDSFREAVSLDPNNAHAHYQLGLALRRKGPSAATSRAPSSEGAAPGAVPESAPMSCSHKGPRNTRSNADQRPLTPGVFADDRIRRCSGRGSARLSVASGVMLSAAGGPLRRSRGRLLVHEHRSRRRPRRAHRLRRQGDQQLPARDHRDRRRRSSTTTVTAGSISSSSTARRSKAFPNGQEPTQPPVSEQGRRHVRGRRPRSAGLAASGWGRARASATTTTTATTICSSPTAGQNRLYHNTGSGRSTT